MIDVHIFDETEAVAQAGAAIFLHEFSAKQGEFVVALSGGSTPKAMHALLATLDIDWGRVTVVLGDERYVPSDDPQSNERMVRETLLNHVPVGRFLPMYRGEGPDADAAAYEAELPPIDLVYLGLGDDAHTASLFPGEPSVLEQERRVIGAKAPVNAPERITLTPAALIKAGKVVFLVTGEAKADASWRCIEGPVDILGVPSQSVARFAPNVVWLTDKKAAVRLESAA
ncbi:6-phosphogluconolactonase [bacterium]|nr:MAG: 6-phosphogluconolactonase [bacterium]